MLRPRPEGGWTLSGNLAELAGAEFMEIFSWFLEAEWHADGPRPATDSVTPPPPQISPEPSPTTCRRPAGHGTGRGVHTTGLPTAASDGERVDRPRNLRSPPPRGETRNPADYAKVVCRTHTGRRLHPDDAINTALIAHIRRVVYDTTGTVIDLGRRSRLFRGAARDAVMLLLTVSGSAATNPSTGATPTTASAGKPTAPPSPATAAHCAHATTNSKNKASPSTVIPTATGTSPTPTATPSPDPAGSALPHEVGDQDGWRCWLCDEPVDPTMSVNDPQVRASTAERRNARRRPRGRAVARGTAPDRNASPIGRATPARAVRNR